MEKKQLPIHKLLDAMAKYESSEWSKDDYIHMLKHMARMTELDEVHAVKLAYIDGEISGVRQAAREVTKEANELIQDTNQYINAHFITTL